MTLSVFHSFIAPFCLPSNAGTENIYTRCRTNPAAEASYDRAVARSFALQLILPHDAVHKRGLCRSAYMSVTFVYCVETAKDKA